MKRTEIVLGGVYTNGKEFRRIFIDHTSDVSFVLTASTGEVLGNLVVSRCPRTEFQRWAKERVK